MSAHSFVTIEIVSYKSLSFPAPIFPRLAQLESKLMLKRISQHPCPKKRFSEFRPQGSSQPAGVGAAIICELLIYYQTPLRKERKGRVY